MYLHTKNEVSKLRLSKVKGTNNTDRHRHEQMQLNALPAAFTDDNELNTNS